MFMVFISTVYYSVPECFGYQHGAKKAQQQHSSLALRWIGSFVTAHPLIDETLSKLFAPAPLFTTYDARCTEFVIRGWFFRES